MTAKKAITFSTDDIDGDGKKDFSLMMGDERLFTLFDAKNLLLKIVGTGVGAFLAAVGFTML